MDTEMKSDRTLPPLVEGKIHGYLRFVIDQVIWLKRNLGEIRVFASWWGETDSAQFRPTDITKSVARSERETTVIYAICTSINLFEEYVKNCECVELVIVTEEETNAVIGTSRITDLLELFELKSLFKYIPIINDSGNKLGEVHISMKLERAANPSNLQLKTQKYDKKQGTDYGIISAGNSFRSRNDMISDRYNACNRLKSDESDVYKSILKSKRTEFQEPLRTVNNEEMDRLVAQVVARAQKLRRAILRETYNEDVLAFSDNVLSDSTESCASVQDQVKLYEYFLGKDMRPIDERKALCTLRSTSPPPGLIDLASNSFKSYRYGNKKITPSNTSVTQTNSSLEDTKPSEEKSCVKPKETQRSNHAGGIRIYVESFTPSPAGYRRVKSSSLSHNDNSFLSATYFVQYDMPFGHMDEKGQKLMKENKRISICSKKQRNQGIPTHRSVALYDLHNNISTIDKTLDLMEICTFAVISFNHAGIYRISKLKAYTEYSIKFKILVRHFNRKSLTELGTGTMHINGIIQSENCSTAHRLIILNKGIKIGELSVIVELVLDSTNFGSEYIDGIVSLKENIPVLETQRLSSQDRNKRSKSATEAQSKTSSQVSSVSVKEVDCLTTDRNLLVTKDISRHRTENIDGKKVDATDQENSINNKVLLQGLIYIAEGKELPELNTYLICRAFWKQDKSRSQICNNTRNPCYQFCQLVPLIHDTDLLDRIKDNYIIIEVYYRNNNVDNLLGLAKLPVHQLYVAYRDPRVLPHLLLSKYPIVSVDGWVPIIDPVTSRSCGQLLALVALGTAEQIALLEMSRGLRNIGTTLQTISCPEMFSGCAQRLQNTQYSIKSGTYKLQSSNMEIYSEDDSQHYAIDTAGRETCYSNLKTQECQTDISTVKELKLKLELNQESQEETSNSEHSVLHTLVDRLTHVLNVKVNIDQAADTMIDSEEKQGANVEEMCINELNFNNSSDESDNGSVRHTFQLPTETYRSVGVGAEYDEGVNQRSNAGHGTTVSNSPVDIRTEKESVDSTCNETLFRAVIEIECALHLPKIKKADETLIAPSTYVSFQANKSALSNQLNSYMITNVFPDSCNPKWNWKCDTKLPTELLLHDEKRLILKIWRILDTDTSTQLNLERDIVIGFSAIDLSILINGFPTVSGWFHIMDFTGKCNGQIKVSITPLDNLSFFRKSTSTCDASQFQYSWLPSCTGEIRSSDTERIVMPKQDENKSVYSENQLNDSVTHVALEDASMSFLSLSLKQKLTELDEITKRLESRLRDVTNTAFEDDFENEFDLNELNSDNENSDYKNADTIRSATPTNDNNNRMCQVSQPDNKLLHNIDATEDERQNVPSTSEIQNSWLEPYNSSSRSSSSSSSSSSSNSSGGSSSSSGSNNSNSSSSSKRAISYETIKPGCSKMSSSYTEKSLSNDNCETQHRDDHSVQDTRTSGDNFTDYPERGTKTHINYLLDKLSLQFPLQPHSTRSMPMKRNITDLMINLQQNNNDLQDGNRCRQKLKVCTVPAQTDNANEEESRLTDGNDACNDEDLPEGATQSQVSNKMSTVIREELVAEENSDTSKCDELTSYLVASNVRHMDLNNMFNPLLYKHLVPDLCHSQASSEGDAVERLDNRYAEAFSTSIDKRLNKVQNFMQVSGLSSENFEVFRMTPAGVAENIDDNIDMTLLRKSSYNDLLASNSTDSTTTISFEKSQAKLIDIEMTENSYSTSSDTSVPVLSRQAPDGGNPVEDVTTPLPLTLQQTDKVEAASFNTYN